MYARTWGETTCGINGEMIVVEVDVANGKFNFEIVGLADTAVKESRERVRSAIKNSSCKFPDQHITVNLAPADLKRRIRSRSAHCHRYPGCPGKIGTA